MHVLIIGIAGTGKSYLADVMKKGGFNALDMDYDIGGFTKFVDKKGNEVEYDPNGGDRWWNTHSYVLNEKMLRRLLKENKTLYFFFDEYKGFRVMGLFDKVYYLKVPKRLIRKRLMTRTSNVYGKNPDEIRWELNAKAKADKKAKELGIKIIDGTQPAGKIIKIITS